MMALRIQPAGQTADDIGAVIEAADTAAAADSVDGCHDNLSFIRYSFSYRPNLFQKIQRKKEEPSVLFYRHVV